jgi:prepilin-type processing-associated H-X9-DG protein
VSDGLNPRSAFEVHARDGRAYLIFADGHVEGFGESPIVINRIPALVRAAERKGREAVDFRAAAIKAPTAKTCRRGGPVRRAFLWTATQAP